jgi:hypothetical protein
MVFEHRAGQHVNLNSEWIMLKKAGSEQHQRQSVRYEQIFETMRIAFNPTTTLSLNARR